MNPPQGYDRDLPTDVNFYGNCLEVSTEKDEFFIFLTLFFWGVWAGFKRRNVRGWEEEDLILIF